MATCAKLWRGLGWAWCSDIRPGPGFPPFPSRTRTHTHSGALSSPFARSLSSSFTGRTCRFSPPSLPSPPLPGRPTRASCLGWKPSNRNPGREPKLSQMRLARTCQGGLSCSDAGSSRGRAGGARGSLLCQRSPKGLGLRAPPAAASSRGTERGRAAWGVGKSRRGSPESKGPSALKQG